MSHAIVTGEVEPFRSIHISRVAQRLQSQGRSIIHMEFGQPATGAPQFEAGDRVALA